MILELVLCALPQGPAIFEVQTADDGATVVSAQRRAVRALGA